jgi:hypothetical protein
MVEVEEKKMDIDPLRLETVQPELFVFGETSEGTIELFPTVWSACEELISQEVVMRRKGLEKLLEVSAPRFSPLVTYLFTTRLEEPDLELRKLVIHALADLLVIDPRGLAAPENVRRTLYNCLSQMKETTILALLESGVADKEMEATLAVLFNANSEAGLTLAEILSDRRKTLDIRFQAIRMIRRVGYLETINDLERLAVRLESRLNGQQAMPFAPPAEQDEQGLLAEIQAALYTLHQP